MKDKKDRLYANSTERKVVSDIIVKKSVKQHKKTKYMPFIMDRKVFLNWFDY